MAVDIQCPHCSAALKIVDVFPGSRIQCPQCTGITILDFQVRAEKRSPIVPPTPGPQVFTGDDIEQLVNAASLHLASWLDVPSQDVKKALDLLEQDKAYHVWKIPKGEGGYSFREISSPEPVLKNIQRRILDRLLYRIPVSNAVHGFVQGRSIVTNAAKHLKTARAIFNVDLKSAFPSVDATRIKHLFVRYLKIPLKHLGGDIPHPVLDQVIELLVKLTTYQNALPQGSPASGYLLNIACITLDKNLYRLLSQHGSVYQYTRYADDITISSPMPIHEDLREKILKVILDCGFQANPKKISYAERTRGQKLEVTGLILEKDKIRIPSPKLEAFRTMFHQASLLAPEELDDKKKLEIQSVVAFIKMVYQRIPYRLWIPYKKYLEKHKIQFPKTSARPQWEQYPK